MLIMGTDIFFDGFLLISVVRRTKSGLNIGLSWFFCKNSLAKLTP